MDAHKDWDMRLPQPASSDLNFPWAPWELQAMRQWHLNNNNNCFRTSRSPVKAKTAPEHHCGKSTLSRKREGKEHQLCKPGKQNHTAEIPRLHHSRRKPTGGRRTRQFHQRPGGHQAADRGLDVDPEDHLNWTWSTTAVQINRWKKYMFKKKYVLHRTQ